MSGKTHANRHYSLGLSMLGLSMIPQAGMNLLRRPQPLRLHTNPGFEITYLDAGEVTWRVENGPELHLTGGGLAVTQPESVHGAVFECIQPCRLLWLVVDPMAPGAGRLTSFPAGTRRELAARLRAAGNGVFCADPALGGVFAALEEVVRKLSIPGSDNAGARPLPSSGTRRFRQSEKGGGALLREEARLLLLRALVLAVRSVGRGAAVTGSLFLAEMRRYLVENLARPLSVPDMARHAGYSLSRFHELFRREAGMTPADYHNRLRCNDARRRLAAGADSVTRIGMELGFSSSQYFAHCFRRYTGMTPSAYRRDVAGREAPET